MLALGLPLAIAGVVGLLILTVVSYRVAARFEARERESPTRLYGRIARAGEGKMMPASEIVAGLKRLGYRQARSNPTTPGEYRQDGRKLTIYIRSFLAPGSESAARAVTIRHRGPRIVSVEDADTGATVDEVALEPEVLTTLYGPQQEDRTLLPLAEFPKPLVSAVLVTEDRHFFSHPGVDPLGMTRAAVANMRNRSIVQGGSTVTQQLAKNLFFDQRRTWSRKLAEAGVAFMLETRYSKDRILQAYLNEVYLGQRGSVSIRGFAEAASFYFGKDVRFLNLSECATLAGLIRAPGLYNPFLHRERARERRDQVLAAMEESGAITAAERKTAQAVALKVRKSDGDRPSSRAVSYLADYIRQMLDEDTASDLSRAGVRVFTTVDPALQRRAEESLSRGIADLEGTYARLRRRGRQANPLQGAMVVLDPKDGSVLAMVGGRDYATSQFNRITQARRQPGSLFKPFVYLAGYEAAESAGWTEEAFTPATSLDDSPFEIKSGGKLWAPANYDNEFRGPVTAQMALEQSLNIPTVRAAQLIGLKTVVATAKDAGIESPLKPYPSLALGAQEVSPLEMASAYATIANGGIRHRPALVTAIEDADGRRIFTRQLDSSTVLSSTATYLVTVGLQGAVDRGTAASARSLGFDGTAAGKTGTTDEYRDAWFAGYTPDLLALVWVGFDDGTSTGLTGAQAALPIWVSFMDRSGVESSDPFEEPGGIVWERVDPASGGLARWSCPDAQWMAFQEGLEPVDRCSLHGWFGGWWSRRGDTEELSRPPN